MAYRNLNRRGDPRSSTSINPRNVAEDISNKIYTLYATDLPLLGMTGIAGSGGKPQAHKFNVMKYYAADPYDYASTVVMGTSVSADLKRFAKLTLDQPSRPDLQGEMYYSPQDKFFITKTGQVVEVVMTPSGSKKIGSGSALTLDANFTGGTTTTSAAGTVIVRNIEPYSVVPFTASDVISMGRSIHESQPIEAEPAERDIVFDCNYIEHKEKVITMTEDQRYLVKTLSQTPDWDFQQEQMFREFTEEIEHTLMWSERAEDLSNSRRPIRHTRGLFHSIETNVSFYNPLSTDDFELMFLNFLANQGFRYNPHGKRKIAICGEQFLINFNLAFREFRHTNSIDPKSMGERAGLNFTTYVIPGDYEIKLATSGLLRKNTDVDNWCFIIDPKEMELKLVKDMVSRMYQLPSERDSKLMVEWQGGIAWHMEETHALLKTF